MTLSAEILQHAREAGVSARKHARGMDACPMYAMGAMGSEWRAAWTEGWERENAEHLRRFPHLAPAVKKGSTTPVRKGRRK